jgi:hypothetical protein
MMERRLMDDGATLTTDRCTDTLTWSEALWGILLFTTGFTILVVLTVITAIVIYDWRGRVRDER